MNISSVIGVVVALIVLIVSIMTSSKSAMVFLDPHGILIVIGGTAAAAMMCFPLKSYVHVAKVIMNKFLGNYATRHEVVINEVVDLARGFRENNDYLKQKLKTLKTPFLADAVELLTQGGISDDELDEILIKRAATHTRRYEYDAGVFRTLAKFPPAFGLMGTTLGMISLLQQLGGKDAQQMLGPAMAIGLVATFYGLTLSNLIFIPIAENLTMINREDETLRSIVIEGIMHIRQKAHPKLVEEHLKSYLLPMERAQVSSKARAR
ncbi:MAG: MotA/TolQ/ExbB proton channel family protein [Moraxellaceae bacterium]|nr:MotA/TolQ/ExbB proton channel family protein [Pseudobdellovibrionaceae bacterium]